MRTPQPPLRCSTASPPAIADSFYTSPEWRALITVIAERGGRCKGPALPGTDAGCCAAVSSS
jgi:hypothetical protein